MWTWLFGWYWWLLEQIRGSWLWDHGGLFATAQGRAEQIAAQGYLSHDGFWGTWWPADCPHGYYGEVIGLTNGDETHVFYGWLNSPGHYEVLMNPVYNAIGYGLTRVGDFIYMVIHMARCW